jgi:hypothetical protein
MLEAASTSETSANLNQTSWRNNIEDGRLRKHFCLSGEQKQVIDSMASGFLTEL